MVVGLCLGCVTRHGIRPVFSSLTKWVKNSLKAVAIRSGGGEHSTYASEEEDDEEHEGPERMLGSHNNRPAARVGKERQAFDIEQRMLMASDTAAGRSVARVRAFGPTGVGTASVASVSAQAREEEPEGEEEDEEDDEDEEEEDEGEEDEGEEGDSDGEAPPYSATDVDASTDTQPLCPSEEDHQVEESGQAEANDAHGVSEAAASPATETVEEQRQIPGQRPAPTPLAPPPATAAVGPRGRGRGGAGSPGRGKGTKGKGWGQKATPAAAVGEPARVAPQPSRLQPCMPRTRGEPAEGVDPGEQEAKQAAVGQGAGGCPPPVTYAQGVIINDFNPRGGSSSIMVKEIHTAESFLIQIPRNGSGMYKRFNQVTFVPGVGKEVYSVHVNDHVKVGHTARIITTPEEAACTIECDLIRVDLGGGSVRMFRRAEGNNRNHFSFQPDPKKDQKHFSWGRMLGRLDFHPPDRIERPLPVLVGTCQDGLTAEGWPAIVALRIDLERLEFSYRRVTPLRLSVAVAEDPELRVAFEIGAVQAHSNNPFFATRDEYLLPKSQPYGLIHAVLLHSYEDYKSKFDQLTTEEKKDTADPKVRGEKSLRYIVDRTGRGAGCSIFINPHNFHTVAVDSWPDHISNFFMLSPLAGAVSQLVLLRFLDRDSTMDNFHVVNEFSLNPCLVTLAMAPSPVVFVKGDAVRRAWIGDRSDLLETICMEVYQGGRQKRGKVEIIEFDALEQNRGEFYGDGLASAPEESELDHGHTFMVSFATELHGHPQVQATLARHRNKMQRHDQVKGWKTIVIRLRPEDSLELAVAAAKEPGSGDYLWSPTLVSRTSNLYANHIRGILVVGNGKMEPEILCAALGRVDAVPVAERVIHVVLPEGHDLESAAVFLRKANALAKAAGAICPFLAVKTDFAGEITWLIKPRVVVARPPAGGGYVYLDGLCLWTNDAALDRIADSMGSMGQGSRSWVTSSQRTLQVFMRVMVRNKAAVEDVDYPQGVCLYVPGQREVFSQTDLEDGSLPVAAQAEARAYVLAVKDKALHRAFMKGMDPLTSTVKQATFREKVRESPEANPEKKDGRESAGGPAGSQAQATPPAPAGDPPRSGGNEATRTLNFGNGAAKGPAAGGGAKRKKAAGNQPAKAKAGGAGLTGSKAGAPAGGAVRQVTFAMELGEDEGQDKQKQPTKDKTASESKPATLPMAMQTEEEGGDWTEVPSSSKKPKAAKKTAPGKTSAPLLGSYADLRVRMGKASKPLNFSKFVSRLGRTVGFENWSEERGLSLARRRMVHKLLGKEGPALNRAVQAWIIDYTKESRYKPCESEDSGGADKEEEEPTEEEGDSAGAGQEAKAEKAARGAEAKTKSVGNKRKGKGEAKEGQEGKESTRKESGKAASTTPAAANTAPDEADPPKVNAVSLRTRQSAVHARTQMAARRVTAAASGGVERQVMVVESSEEEDSEEDSNEEGEGDSSSAGGALYEVESITEERVSEGGEKEFLVNWVDYPEDQSTWMTIGELQDAAGALKAFHKLRGSTAGSQGADEEWKEAVERAVVKTVSHTPSVKKFFNTIPTSPLQPSPEAKAGEATTAVEGTRPVAEGAEASSAPVVATADTASKAKDTEKEGAAGEETGYSTPTEGDSKALGSLKTRHRDQRGTPERAPFAKGSDAGPNESSPDPKRTKTGDGRAKESPTGNGLVPRSLSSSIQPSHAATGAVTGATDVGSTSDGHNFPCRLCPSAGGKCRDCEERVRTEGERDGRRHRRRKKDRRDLSPATSGEPPRAARTDSDGRDSGESEEDRRS